MNKKIISMALAICMVFGSAAALPHSDFVSTPGITASADNPVSGNYQYSVLSDGTVKITWYTSKAAVKSVTIPSTIAGRKVTAIGEQAFYEKHIGTITVPEGVKTIENSAFIGCTATTINIPSTVTTIAGSAFLKCESLKNINVSASNKTYASVDGALLNKAKTEFLICPAGKTTYTVPSGVTNVKEYSFWSCNKLKSVTFAASVKTIANKAIYYCGELLTINLGSGVTSDINWIADECPKLKNINVHKNNKVYSSVDGAVYNKNKTTLVKVPVNKDKLSIPSTVTEIGESAASHNTALTSLYIPNNVKKIGKYAFCYCPALKSVIFTNGLTEIGPEAFRECTSLTSVSIPKGLTTIDTEEFFTCRALSSANIPNTVENIYGLAFKYTNVNDIYIPASVKNIASGSEITETGSGFTVYGQKNTEAQKYAKRIGAAFKEISQPLTRFAGAGRFDTAKTISAEGGQKYSKTVVLAYGLNYADALAGVPLAASLNAPILLTNKDTLPEETLGEIKRLGANEVIVLGGEGAISNNVVKTLTDNKLTVKRYAGTSRFGTATKIASKLGSEPKEIFFVYGLNYADALSVSTVAAVKNAPIIYLKTNGELDKETADYLKSVKGKVKNAYVIGGAGVISDDMMKKAGSALGLTFNKTITRVAGKNRYATCVAVNNKFKGVLSGKALCIAKGLDFPDALAGGVFAAANKAPLFLADNKLTDEQTKYLKAKKASQLYVFGGTGAVPNSLVQSISAASK